MQARQSRFFALIAPALVGVGLSVVACGSSGQSDPGGHAATGGSSTGGTTGTGGSGTGGRGGSGDTSDAGNATGGSGGTSSGGGTGDATGGGAGTGGAGAGGAGTGGTAGTATGGSAGGGAGGGPVDAGADATPVSSDAGSERPARILLYTKRSTPTHDASIPVATKSLSDLFKSISVEVEASEATTVFTKDNLARFGAVVMVNSNGTPFGTPGTTEANALLDFVRGGGGFAAFHAAGNTSYPAGHPFLTLLGGTFQNTGGGVRSVTCTPEPQQPVVAKVPNPLAAPGDETYVFGDLNPMNQVVLRCDPATGTAKQVSAWIREEGAGRVFYTTLGHGPPSWQAGGPILTTHAWPGILWVLSRD